MTEALLPLARRLVAAPGWRWLPGMLLIDDDGTPVRFVVELGTHALGMVQGGGHPVWRKPLPLVALPDLSDDLTALGLLALVRERWAMPNLAAVRKDGAWMLWAGGLPDALYRLRAPTELEVLILALEVAP
jgi:hypothetical protein